MRFLLLGFLFFSLISCSNNNVLAEEFNCESVALNNLIERTDFKKKFKLEIPSNWKTKLYYTEFQSELFAADTTKQLTETYILNTSFNLGKLNFDALFSSKNDSILILENLNKINSKSIQFKDKPAHWILASGFKNGFPFHQFKLSIKLSESTYFSCATEIYGDELVNERICESISIINNIEFLQ